MSWSLGASLAALVAAALLAPLPASANPPCPQGVCGNPLIRGLEETACPSHTGDPIEDCYEDHAGGDLYPAEDLAGEYAAAPDHDVRFLALDGEVVTCHMHSREQIDGLSIAGHSWMSCDGPVSPDVSVTIRHWNGTALVQFGGTVTCTGFGNAVCDGGWISFGGGSTFVYRDRADFEIHHLGLRVISSGCRGALSTDSFVCFTQQLGATQ